MKTRTAAILLAMVTVAAVALADLTALSNNLRIHPTPSFENSSKVAPPTASCPRGRIVLSAGAPAKIEHRPLVDGAGNLDFSTTTSEVAFPTGATKQVATDNQTVRLKDGSFLIERDTFVWDPLTPPVSWVGTVVSGPSDPANQVKGPRGNPVFFRSTDCGNTWSLYSQIDFATALGGKYGFPQVSGTNPDGTPTYHVGGVDRTEIYVCPFTGFVYLTTRVRSGPFGAAPAQDTALLFYSTDAGRTWSLIKEDLPDWSPLMITSTPNGRLFLFQQFGLQPFIWFSKAPVQATTPPEMVGYPVNYIENGVPVPDGIPCSTSNAGCDPKTLDYFMQAFHPTISRISMDTSTSKVRAAYQSLDANGNEQERIVSVDVQDPNQPPVVTNLKTIVTATPSHSVVYASFIDPDYQDMPPGTKSNTAVLYWVEAPQPGIANRKLAARYVVFDGDNDVSCPAYLSVQNGAPRTWTISQALGDYMSGGFYWRGNTLNYLAQWVEPDGVKANVLTTQYHAGCSLNPSAPPPAWSRNTNYALGALVTFNAIVYEARQGHTSQVGWEPPNVPALWQRPTPCHVAPWSAQTSYVVGSEVTFNGARYRAIQLHTSQVGWQPTAAPALWGVVPSCP